MDEMNDGQDEEVVVTVVEGLARVYPRSVRSDEHRYAYDLLVACQAHLFEIEAERDLLVTEARAAGLSWNAIGTATAYTGLGAQNRWGRSE